MLKAIITLIVVILCSSVRCDILLSEKYHFGYIMFTKSPYVMLIPISETQRIFSPMCSFCFIYCHRSSMMSGRHVADHIMSRWKPLYLLCRCHPSLAGRPYREFILFCQKTTRCILVAVTILLSYQQSPLCIGKTGGHSPRPPTDIVNSYRYNLFILCASPWH